MNETKQSWIITDVYVIGLLAETVVLVVLLHDLAGP